MGEGSSSVFFCVFLSLWEFLLVLIEIVTTYRSISKTWLLGVFVISFCSSELEEMKINNTIKLKFKKLQLSFVRLIEVNFSSIEGWSLLLHFGWGCLAFFLWSCCFPPPPCGRCWHVPKSRREGSSTTKKGGAKTSTAHRRGEKATQKQQKDEAKQPHPKEERAPPKGRRKKHHPKKDETTQRAIPPKGREGWQHHPQGGRWTAAVLNWAWHLLTNVFLLFFEKKMSFGGYLIFCIN